MGVPIAFLRVTQDPFNVPKLALLIVGVSSVLALRVAESFSGRSWRGLETLLVPAAFIVVPLTLSWLVSPYRGWGVLGLQGRFQGLVPYVLVILFGMLVADGFRGRVSELALALMWAGAIVGGYALLQTIGADPFNWSLYGAPTESVSTTGNPNFTGGFLGIVLPIGLGLVLSDPGRRRIAIRLFVPIVGGWLVARSQGGWAAGVAGCAIVGGYHLRGRYPRSHLVAWALATVVALTTVGVVLIAMIRPDSRFTMGSAVVRSRWSQAAFEMGVAHPLAGRGPNSFAIEGVRHRSLEDALAFSFDFPDDPHSVPMAMFANLGVLGLIGFVGVLGWALWFFLKERQPSLLRVAFIGGVVAYFVQALVSIDELTLRLGLWAAVGGLLASSFVEEKKSSTSAKGRRDRRSTSNRAPVKGPSAGLAVPGIVLLGCVAWAGSILLADVYARQGSARFDAGDVQGGRAKYDSALSLRDSADYRGRLAFGLKALAVDEEGNVDEEALAAADEAFSFTDEIPYVFSIVGHARMLEEAAIARKTTSEEAAILYNRAMRLDPRNPMIRVELARVLLRSDASDEALGVLIDMREVIGAQVPEYWGVLALAAARTGQVDLADEAAGVALSISPGQADATRALEILDRART